MDTAAPQSTAQGAEKPFYVLFGFFLLWQLALLWINKYLPMVDLPAHAAQIAAWANCSEPGYPYASWFEFMLFQPYILPYYLVRMFMFVMPILIAIKVTISLAVLAMPLVLLRLCRVLRIDPIWSFAGFIIVFNYSFYWGFFQFIVTLPVGILYLAESLRDDRTRGRLSWIGLFLMAFFLGMSHALVAVVFIGLSWLFQVLRRSGWKGLLAHSCLAAAAAIPIAIWGFDVLLNATGNDRMATLWGMGAFRLWELPSFLLSSIPGGETEAILLGGALLLLPLALGGRLSRRPERWVLFALALSLPLVLPLYTFGTLYLYGRLAVTVFPFLLLLIEAPAPEGGRRRLAKLLMPLLVAVWLVELSFRWAGYDNEARRFDPALERIAPGKRVLALYFDGFSRHIASYHYSHFADWYTAEKKGITEVSMFGNKGMPTHYAATRRQNVDEALEFDPERFEWSRANDFDYYLVLSYTDRRAALFPPESVELVIRSGDWWLYRRLPSPRT